MFAYQLSTAIIDIKCEYTVNAIREHSQNANLHKAENNTTYYI